MIVFPPQGILSPRQEQFRHDRGDREPRSRDRRVPPEVCDDRRSCRRCPTRSPGSTRRTSSKRIRTGTKRTSWGPARSSSPDYEAGQSIKGVRNPDYYMPGKPYLDGIVAIYAPKQATRVDAIRSDRAAIEFRGLPPASRDELKKAARRQDRSAGERLELRQRRHDQPREKAVRRRARAARADPGDRSLERRRRRCRKSPMSAPSAASSSRPTRWRRPRSSCTRSPATGPTSRSRGPRRSGC